ncbi:MAG: SH3 domain-containing protein [Burkholderiaceae bacterium]
MSGVRAVLSFSLQPRVIAGLLACAIAWGSACAADASAPAASAASASASAPAEAASAVEPRPLVATVPVPGTSRTVDIAAPLATVSAPTVPVADSVIGGEKVERFQVTDPYIELHTFPGRGYPVFFVAARGEWIAIELRHTDWYKVRTAGGKEGWVSEAQLRTTLAENGLREHFGDAQFNDYLARRVELGAGYGRFHQEPMIKFWLSYRLSDTLSIESTLGQVQGVFSGTTLWHVNLQAEPWSDQRFSPFAGIGIGQFKNIPNQSLVNFQPTNARLSDAIVGARYHLTDRFMIRVDYAVYTAFVSDQRSLEYRAATAGLSFFF